jgi:hypothetical protein
VNVSETTVVSLTDDDIRILRRSQLWDDGGYQNLFHELRGRWESLGCGRLLPIWPNQVERIHRYANDYGKGGWQDALKRIASQLPAADVLPTQGGLL